MISTSDAMLFAGVALFCVITLRKWYRRHGRRGRQLAAKRDSKPVLEKQTKYSAPLIDAPVEVLRWQVEMHDLARDLSAQLDSKMSALQALIARAETQCERLEKLIDEEQKVRN